MAVEGGGGILSEESIIVGKIKITPDIRTNRIHVVTRPINMPFIRQLIHELMRTLNLQTSHALFAIRFRRRRIAGAGPVVDRAGNGREPALGSVAGFRALGRRLGKVKATAAGGEGNSR